ncbi:MAG: hypothetical protein OEZ36_07170 [Spirochaetota bacterium]|nr:hypothetical protein [Spirochaetota bacterium]
MTKIYTRCILVFILLLVSGDIDASRVNRKSISLSELIKKSRYIFLVTPLNPHRTTESIDITPKGSQKSYPPFIRTFYHYKVLESLKPSQKVFPDKIIVGAYSNWKLSLHRAYYLQGRSKSNTYPFYGTISGRSVDFIAKQYIIFIEKMFKDKSRYVFVAENAREFSKQRDKVMEAIRLDK